MTDIVQRLREQPTMSVFANMADMVGRLNHERGEAADEIERLRAALRDIACDCEHDCADSPLGLSPVTPNCCRNFARKALGEKE